MRKFLIPVFLIALFVVLNWPWSLSELYTEFAGDGINILQSGPSNSTLVATTAGWPIKYYQKSGLNSGDTLATFSWLALLGNIFAWSSALAAFVTYYRLTRRLAKRERQEVDQDLVGSGEAASSVKTNNKKSSDLQLADLFLVTAMVAAAFGYWKLLQSRKAADKALASEISGSGGAVKFATRLPNILRSYTFLHPACARITEVRLRGPNDGVLEKVVQLPYLNVLNIVGGQNDLKKLAPLRKNPMLVELAVVGRELDSGAIQSIQQIKSLRSLNLMRTNITTKGLLAMGLQDLKQLNIIHTDVKLAELNEPQFAKSLKVLSIPHPPKGQGDSFRVENWPELEELYCLEYDELMNAEPVSLRLKNLPKLKTLKLDSLQLFDLDLEQLPQLSKLEFFNIQWDRRTSVKQVVPSWSWVRNLRLRSLPQMKELSIFAANTESIDIEQDTPMWLGLCVYDQSHKRDASKYGNPAFAMPSVIDVDVKNQITMPPGYLDSKAIRKETRQKWIDTIATSKNIETLDISYTPLNDLDLSPISKNGSIKRLVLGHSALNVAQLKGLVGMNQLEELSVEGVRLDGRQVEWLATTFPNLRTLTCENSEIKRLRLEKVPNLETIFEKPKNVDNNPWSSYYNLYQPLEALKIVDTPKLRDKISSHAPMILVHIEAAPSLRGLSFPYPLPKGCVLKGLRDLEHFHAGGATCDDVVVNEVLKCKNLRRLTLAYSSASAESLNRIAELRELEYLVLTGSAANDQLLASLPQLSKLKTLRLDNTQISEKAASLVAQISQLQFLDLGEQKLPANVVSELLKLSQLRNLNLAGCEVTSEHLAAFSKLSELQTLDLSQCELSNEQLDILAKNRPPKLMELKLNQSKLGAKGFSNLVKAFPKVRFGLRDTDINSGLMDQLVSQNRVTEFSDEDTSLSTTYIDGQAMIIRRSSGNVMRYVAGVEAPMGDTVEGDIDPIVFSPRPPANNLGNGFGDEMEFDEGPAGATQQSVPSPAMNPIEKLGYELFRLRNWGSQVPQRTK